MMDLMDEARALIKPATVSRRGFLGWLGITACTVDFGRRAVQKGMELLDPTSGISWDEQPDTLWEGQQYRWDHPRKPGYTIGNGKELPVAKLYSVETGEEFMKEVIFVNETTGEYEEIAKDSDGITLLNPARTEVAIRKGRLKGGLRVEFSESVDEFRAKLERYRREFRGRGPWMGRF